jgi:hypothetical protein
MPYVSRITHQMRKDKFSVTSPRAFYGNRPGPPDHEKLYVDVSCPDTKGMHYVTYRSHQM